MNIANIFLIAARRDMRAAHSHNTTPGSRSVWHKFEGTMKITQTFSNFKRFWGRFELCFEF